MSTVKLSDTDMVEVSHGHFKSAQRQGLVPSIEICVQFIWVQILTSRRMFRRAIIYKRQILKL